MFNSKVSLILKIQKTESDIGSSKKVCSYNKRGILLNVPSSRLSRVSHSSAYSNLMVHL